MLGFLEEIDLLFSKDKMSPEDINELSTFMKEREGNLNKEINDDSNFSAQVATMLLHYSNELKAI